MFESTTDDCEARSPAVDDGVEDCSWDDDGAIGRNDDIAEWLDAGYGCVGNPDFGYVTKFSVGCDR
jgi:hypothetical protein